MTKRIHFIDNAKVLGILLVYYGHFVEKIFKNSDSDIAFYQWKFIYSFHMPLFFLIAGLFFKEEISSFGEIVKKKFKSRIFPVITFAIIALPFWFLMTDKSLSELLVRASQYLSGQSRLNFVMWFLVCLFTVEMLFHYSYLYIAKQNKNLRFLLPIAFFIIGYLAIKFHPEISKATGLIKNFWFVNEAFVALGFYSLGYILKDYIFSQRKKLLINIILVSICFAVLVLTWNINFQGVNSSKKIVMLVSSRHGNYLWFLVTAISGAFFVIFFTKLLNIKITLLSFISKNAIVYLGVNGILLNFFNTRIIKLFSLDINNHFSLFLYCILYSIVAMLLVIPIAWLFKKYLWFFVGLKNPHQSN